MNTLLVKLTKRQIDRIEAERQLAGRGSGVLAQPFTAITHERHGEMEVSIIPYDSIAEVQRALTALKLAIKKAVEG